ncbi:MAG TPA: DMT family transporter, partial [Verrucomicrobiae bacterium]|nr:DMT family transporter [Verrucomicrobiae bacterium]
MNKEIKGGVLVALSTLGSGSMSVFAKLAYASGANVLTVLFVRFILAGIMLAGICVITRTSLMVGKKKAAIFLALGFFGYGIMACLFFNSLRFLSAPVVALILYSYPAIVFVLCLVTGKERFSPLKLISLLLSLGGISLVIGGEASGLNPTGVVLVLASAILYAVYIVLSKDFMADTSPLVATTFITIGSVLFNIVWAGISRDLSLSISPLGWLAIGAVALFSTVLALILFLQGLTYVGSSAAAIISTVEPVITIALAGIIFGE